VDVVEVVTRSILTQRRKGAKKGGRMKDEGQGQKKHALGI
jgi:hypothetical protein